MASKSSRKRGKKAGKTNRSTAVRKKSAVSRGSAIATTSASGYSLDNAPTFTIGTSFGSDVQSWAGKNEDTMLADHAKYSMEMRRQKQEESDITSSIR